MSNRNITIGLVVVAVIAIIGIFTPAFVKNASTRVGAVTPYATNFTALGLGINDKYVVTSAQRIGMTTSSITPCSFISPSATTSLQFVSVNMTSTSLASTTIWVISTSTTATGTSSPISALAAQLAAATKFSWAWGSGTNNSVLPPSTYVNLGVQASSSADLANVAGTCQVEFITL